MRRNVAGQRVIFSLFKSGARIANPTMALADFTVALDGGAQNNVSALPTSDAAGKVIWLPTQAETNADTVTFLANDVLGAQWEPLTIAFDTRDATDIATIVTDYSTLTQADILSDATPFPGGNIDAAISGTAVPGDAMALTPAERTTVAMVFWNTLTTALTTVGSIGKFIVDYLTAIAAKTTLIGTGRAVVTAPITAGGDVTTIRGDSYLNVDGRRIEWTSTTWAIAVTSTLVVIIQDTENFAATRLSATEVGLELTTAQTAALPVVEAPYAVQEIKNTGQRITLTQGSWNNTTRPIPLT